VHRASNLTVTSTRMSLFSLGKWENPSS